MVLAQRCCVVAIVTTFFIPWSLHAQAPATPLTLEECVRMAEEAPSSLRIARQQSVIAKLDVKQAQAGLLPRAGLNSGFTYNSPLQDRSPVQSFVGLNGVREYLFVATATEELDISGRLRAETARARADLDAARIGETISRRDLKRMVASVYYRLLLAQHVAHALRDSVAEAESFEQRTRLLVNNGEASQADLAKASAEAGSLKQALNAADLDARLAQQELASFWTAAVNDPVQVVDVFATVPLPEPASEVAGARSFEHRPEFGVLDAQKRSFLAESRRIRAELFPQASVSFQYGLDSTVVHARDRGYAAFVNLTVPVFDWMRTLNASRTFRTRSDQVETQRAMTERAFSREYEAAVARVESALTQVELAVRQVRLGEEDLRLSRVRFEGGEGPALDVVAAQTQLVQARINYYTALSTYWNGRADLEVAAGR